MSNQITTTTPTEDSDNGGVLSNVAGMVTDLVTGTTIPTPVKRNLLKAFSQLCTALIDIPVSHLEGIATEKRAETQARVKIISTGADQIATQMDVAPDYARAAVRKYAQRIVREQINVDKVTEVASQQIYQDASRLMIEQGNGKTAEQKGTEQQQGEQDVTSGSAVISDDWLNSFEREASQMSSEEMQLLFGRILAGEIQKPSSFSVRTVKILSSLDPRAAHLFRTLCSICISSRIQDHIMDARVPSLGGNAGANSLQAYGLGFDQLNVLHEYGLVIPDYNSYYDYASSVYSQSTFVLNRDILLPFTHQDRRWALIPPSDATPNGRQVTSDWRHWEVRIDGVALTTSGKELLKIVDVQPNEQYLSALQEHFAKSNFQMHEMPNNS